MAFFDVQVKSQIIDCCKNFVKAAPFLQRKGLSRIGRVGHAKAQIMKSRDVVRTVREMLQRDKLLFLCPREEACVECDEARAYADGVKRDLL